MAPLKATRSPLSFRSLLSLGKLKTLEKLIRLHAADGELLRFCSLYQANNLYLQGKVTLEHNKKGRPCAAHYVHKDGTDSVQLRISPGTSYTFVEQVDGTPYRITQHKSLPELGCDAFVRRVFLQVQLDCMPSAPAPEEPMALAKAA